MDQLELLKKDWKSQEDRLPKLSKEDLSKLIHKKSSSVVKWIFIISILEFIIPNIIFLFADFEGLIDQSKKYGAYNFSIGSTIFMYIIVVIFIYVFYKNYRSICVSENSKKLMQNIIKTRKTVKYYIWFNLIMAFVVGLVTLYIEFNSPVFIEKTSGELNMTVMWLIAIIVMLAVVGIFWLFYQLLYGILLKKLKRNYDELRANGN